MRHHWRSAVNKEIGASNGNKPGIPQHSTASLSRISNLKHFSGCRWPQLSSSSLALRSYVGETLATQSAHMGVWEGRLEMTTKSRHIQKPSLSLSIDWGYHHEWTTPCGYQKFLALADHICIL